jgi:hypothetical protein
VEVQHGLALLVRKQRAHAGHLVDAAQHALHGLDDGCPAVGGTDHDAAAVVGAAEHDHRRAQNAFATGEFLDGLVHHVAVFEAHDEHAPQPGCRVLHADAPCVARVARR